MNLEPFLKSEPNASLLEVREFVQLEILRRISTSELKSLLAFKGGTALHLLYHMDRFSEDLDFSVTVKTDEKKIGGLLKPLLMNEEITDQAVKRRTILFEIRQTFGGRAFRLKIEINTDDVVPGEPKTLFAPAVPASFSIQAMRSDWLTGQKVRAFLQRKKARDLYDLWFLLKTRLPLDFRLISRLTNISEDELPEKIQERIESTTEREIVTDLNPFLEAKLRDWTRRSLKVETLQLFRALELQKHP